ncbi:MAG: transposase, partial [Nitrosopumilaceae archaeon]|nr:transposase [Nitrosopumilaceae archaeon]
GRIKLIFLPPHTPQLNPIEIQWRVLKRLLACRYFETLEEIKNAIEAIVQGEMKPVRLMPYLTDRYRPA